MSRSRLLTTLPAVLAALVLAACGSGEPQQQPGPSPTGTPTATATPSPSAPVAGARAPLSGERTGDTSPPTRPVLAVKIDNAQAARPQAGIGAADVVIEERVEGGVTRFIALFQSEVPDRLGPVRSARLVDARVLPAYAPIFAYSGARDEVSAALRRAGLARLTPGQGGVFERDPNRPGSHNLFTTGSALYDRGADMADVGPPPRRPVWPYDEQAPSGGEATGQLSFRMSGSALIGWDWDGQDGLWRRSQNGTPTRVAGGGQLGVANVVALGMQIGTGGCCDTAGNPYVTTQVVGEGEGVVLRDGRAYPIRWSKSSADSHVRLTRPDGTLLQLKPGSTWMHLMPAENLPDVGGSGPTESDTDA